MYYNKSDHHHKGVKIHHAVRSLHSKDTIPNISKLMNDRVIQETD